MSLLLDALKKAAEKKAKKSSAVDDGVESTDIADSQNAQAVSQQDDTALTDTIALDHEPTQLDQETEFSEATEIDATSIDETQLTESTIIKASADDHEPTQLDHETEFSEATEIDATSIDETLLTESTIIKAAAEDHESTQLDHETEFSEATEIDATSIDETQLTESTIIESAADDHEPAQLGQETEYSETIEMDAVSMDETVSTEVKALDQESVSDTSAKESKVAEMDSTSDDETQINDDEFDTALIDTISQDRDITQFDKMDVTSLDNTDMKDDTEMEYQSQLSEEDRTLFIYDGADREEGEAGEETEAALTKTDAFFRHQVDDNDGLTEEDVTQFMGDGVSKPESSKPVSKDQLQSEARINSDDTTLTNPESLTMTNFSFPEHAAEESVASEAVPLQDQTQSDTFSLHEHDGRPVEDQTSTHSLYQNDVLDDDKSTRINTDSTSTISSIDIEKLTSDQTVTIGSKTTTKTFAPDNYDRTLLNLSQKDVSRIFPGMQPESDAVMTPDYAKRVFLSKSGQVKTHYYKLYAGIGLMLLLSVIMWGLFLLQEESDLIDQRLANLKRDPMPGIIKPQNENESQRLFLPDSKESNLKAVDIIAKAGEPESTESTPVENEIADSAENQVDSSLPVQDEFAEVTADTQDEEIAKTDNMQVSSDVSPTTEIKSVQPTRTSAASTLSISTGSKISQKNKLLTEAFEAYEQGDLANARKLYSEVLTMDESDRDGLLGRAAVHILDNEYQQAINKYQKLLVDNPKDSMAMASLISVANIDPQSGETQLKKLLREQPESPYLHFALGNMYGSQNRWNEAQNSYFEAMQNRPDDPNYAYNLAVSLEHIGKPGTAIIFYQKALKNSSNGLITFDEQLVIQRLEVLAQ
ncbi:MAG: tetratricopeptide repeat protein [Gammaproteobacteria bacterium]|nr:tetratricopeptide repeat protein [Gammaproteobacteria bacterium]